MNSIFSEENLKRLFGEFSCSKTHEAWILKKKCRSGGFYNIKINKDKIHDILSQDNKYQFENFSLYNKKHSGIYIEFFEHIVKIVYEHPHLKIKPVKSAIYHFYVSPISEEYSLFLYLANVSYSSEARSILRYKLERFEGKTIDFWEVIRILNEEKFKLKSLKIKSLIPLSHSDWDRLAKSYLFKCAYRYNAIVSMSSIFKEVNPLYPNDTRFFYTDETLLGLDIKEELLNYYQQAVRLKDPFESFLSFYHIFEYFFKLIGDEFKEDVHITVSNKFAGSEEDFKNIILINDLNNERKLLELVFRKFINESLFKAELNYFDPKYYSYLKNNNVTFAKANKIDDTKFYESLTRRVYKIRNALVHRKEGVKEPKYLPYNDEHKKELRKELLLMKIIANQIIIKNRGTLKHW